MFCSGGSISPLVIRRPQRVWTWRSAQGPRMTAPQNHALTTAVTAQFPSAVLGNPCRAEL